jgi:hypothetical protein
MLLDAEVGDGVGAAPTVRFRAYCAAIQALAFRAGMEVRERDSVPIGTRQINSEKPSFLTVVVVGGSPSNAPLGSAT